MEPSFKEEHKSYENESDAKEGSNNNSDENQNFDSNMYFNIFFLILFSIIFITNLIYFNAPNHKLEHLTKNNGSIKYDFYSYYKVISKISQSNIIKIELERINQDNLQISNKIFMHLIFGINNIKIKISPDEEDNCNINDFFENNDFNLENKQISFLDESNIGVYIYNYPFNFILYRKDSEFNETIFDTRNQNNKTMTISNNFKSLYTKVPKGYFAYGLGEEFHNIRLIKNKKYNLNVENSTEIFEIGKKEAKTGYSAFPLLLMVHPTTFNPHGIVFLTEDKMEFDLQEDEIIFNQFGNSFEFFILLGKSPKEVIEENQKVFGKPFLPPYQSLEWQDSVNSTQEIDPNTILKSVNYNYTNKEPTCISSRCYPVIKNTYTSQNKLDEIKNKVEETLSTLTEVKQITLDSTFVFSKSEVNLNIIPLIELKLYCDWFDKENIPRPVIFSKTSYVGGQQYAGKWLGKVESNMNGIKQSLLQTMKYNIYGNPHVVHEACGNLIKDINYSDESILLCLKWIQMVSLFPHVRINRFNLLRNLLIKNNKKEFIDILQDTLSFRYSLALYIYSYYIKMTLEGGSLIRSLFLDFNSKLYTNDLMELENQFMVGSNIMIYNHLEHNSDVKKIFFPSNYFYNFYTGELINGNGVGVNEVKLYANQLNIFLRAGLITPTQKYKFDLNNYNNVNSLRKLPINLIIALDQNYRSTGRILINDVNNRRDSTSKNLYYKMEISTVYNNDNCIISFHVDSNRYKLLEDEYPYIEEILIYGYNRISIKKISFISKYERVELLKSQYIFDYNKNVLRIIKLNIDMDFDSKIIIN